MRIARCVKGIPHFVPQGRYPLGRGLSMPLLCLCLLLSLPVLAAGDPKLGKPLHDKQCVACHVKLLGGDGSGMYTRKPRLINDAVALGQRVAACAAQTNAGWFPEDEAHVTAWLNQNWYKFK
ncbi:MAG: cytochrome c [Sulfuritalea sp.]|nr:cytochrome c [Sulfuritalea sp.]